MLVFVQRVRHHQGRHVQTMQAFGDVAALPDGIVTEQVVNAGLSVCHGPAVTRPKPDVAEF
jgi:hypothetical protein